MSNLYADTDSVKQVFNSVYGTQVRLNRDYISVIVDDNPTVIFKRNIIAVSKDNSYTSIKCANGYDFLTKEDYASVVKKIIG